MKQLYSAMNFVLRHTVAIYVSLAIIYVGIFGFGLYACGIPAGWYQIADEFHLSQHRAELSAKVSEIVIKIDEFLVGHPIGAQAAPVNVSAVGNQPNVQPTLQIADEKSELPEAVLRYIYLAFIRKDNPKLTDAEAEQIADSYVREENRRNLRRGLPLAMTMRESSHKPKAVSCADAHGLMQVLPDSGKWIAKKEGMWQSPKPSKAIAKSPAKLQKFYNQAEREFLSFLTEPKNNIRIGTGILEAFNKEAHGNLPVALARYSGNANRYSEIVLGYHQEISKAIEFVSTALEVKDAVISFIARHHPAC